LGLPFPDDLVDGAQVAINGIAVVGRSDKATYVGAGVTPGDRLAKSAPEESRTPF
jgi:hypothetical protein